MRLVIVESPYSRGDLLENLRYARECMLDCLMRGEAPMLGHILYTQVLDDNNARHRTLGMQAALAWGRVADATVVYTDLGVTPGMEHGIANAKPSP